EHALETVSALEQIVDVQLRPNDRPARRKRVSRARVDDEAGIDVRVLVEVEQTPSVRRIGIVAVGETATVDPRGRHVKSAARVHGTRGAGQPLVVVEVEVPRGRIGREETAADWTFPVGVIDRQVHVAREWSWRPYFQHAFEPRYADLGDVHRRDNRGSRHSRIVDAGRALLPVRRTLCDQTEGEPTYVPT